MSVVQAVFENSHPLSLVRNVICRSQYFTRNEKNVNNPQSSIVYIDHFSYHDDLFSACDVKKYERISTYEYSILQNNCLRFNITIYWLDFFIRKTMKSYSIGVNILYHPISLYNTLSNTCNTPTLHATR